MIELVVLGALAFVALMVLGILGTVFSLFFTLVVLPFKLIGFLLKGVLAVVFLGPVLLVLGFVGLFVLGAGLIALLTPLLPFALLGLGIWWLLKRRNQATATPAP